MISLLKLSIQYELEDNFHYMIKYYKNGICKQKQRNDFGIMITLYLVLPCYNEELIIEDSAQKLKVLMNGLKEDKKISVKSKVIFVDDGSLDNTWRILDSLCKKDALFGYIRLARNRGHQNALLAGMLTVKDDCDAVITLDADLQHDIFMIPKFIALYEQGYEIVYGVRKNRNGESNFKKLSGDAFYCLMKMLGTKVIKNHADYRLLGTKALSALSKYEESNLFLRGIIPYMGFSATTLEYEEKPRSAGKSKYSMKKMLQLAMAGITSFSVRPLQMITLFGGIIFVFSIVMLVYALCVYTQEGSVSGWTSTVIPIWLLGGIQLLALGVVGEYIGKIYLETKHRPRYEIEMMMIKQGDVDADRK